TLGHKIDTSRADVRANVREYELRREPIVNELRARGWEARSEEQRRHPSASAARAVLPKEPVECRRWSSHRPFHPQRATRRRQADVVVPVPERPSGKHRSSR
ncbi:unnamed protein product, partial [Ectocarpus sp. 13 AM-2016]